METGSWSGNSGLRGAWSSHHYEVCVSELEIHTVEQVAGWVVSSLSPESLRG